MDKKKKDKLPVEEKREDLKIEGKKKFKGSLLDVLKKPVRKKD